MKVYQCFWNVVTRRIVERFPEDFMFELTKGEHKALPLQSASAKAGRGGGQTPPYAFTEHGVAMLSSVLNSDRAVRIRELLATNKDLAACVETLEAAQKKHASVIGILAGEIDQMKRLPAAPKRRIGYNTGQ